MRTGIYAMLTCIIVAGAYFGGMKMDNPLPAYGVALAALVLFFIGMARRSKKAAQRRLREHMFQQHMRMTLRNQWH